MDSPAALFAACTARQPAGGFGVPVADTATGQKIDSYKDLQLARLWPIQYFCKKKTDVQFC